MKEQFFEDYKFEMKSDDNSDKMEIEGLAVEFGAQTRNKTRYSKNTYSNYEGLEMPALFNHDTDKVIGKVEFTKHNKGIGFKMKLNQNLELAKDVWEMVKHGDISGVSTGSYVEDYEFVETEDGYFMDMLKAELFELSIVTVPSSRNARISNFESMKKEDLENKTENKEDIKMSKEINYEDLNIVELNESIDSLNEKKAKKTDKLEKVSNQITESNDVEKAEKLLNQKEELLKTIETIDNSLDDAKKVRAVKEHQLNEIKLKNDKIQISNKTEGVEMENNKDNVVSGIESFMKTKKAKDLFIDAVAETVKTGNKKLKDVYGEMVAKEGFAGDIDKLFPTYVNTDIQELLEKNQRLLPFINIVVGVTNWTTLVNESEELGYGHQGDNATKVEQSNALTSLDIVSQYIYKYVTVAREQLDQPSNVLYNYVIKELSERLVMTIERAILVGDGLTNVDPKKIKTIIPMASITDTNYATDVTFLEINDDLFEDLDVEILNGETSRTIFAMNKRTLSALKKVKDGNGNKIYDVSSVTVNGRNYTTLDDNLIVTNPYIPSFDEAGEGDVFVLAFTDMSYTMIQYQAMAEMIMDFQLQTNTNEFLTEIRAGGNQTKPKALVLGKKTLVTPTKATTTRATASK